MNIRKISILELSHEEKGALLILEDVFLEILNTIDPDDDKNLKKVTVNALNALTEFVKYFGSQLRT